MKKYDMKNIFKQVALIAGVLAILTMQACKKEDDDPVVDDPVASFQYAISEENYLQVTFSNFSQNAESYFWSFGDGNNSTEENPVHTYSEVGNYEVILSATNSAGVNSVFTETIEIKDPFEALTRLAGQTSKTWRLYREGYSMGVGPDLEGAYNWWALENDGSRPCKYQHEITFNRDMQYIFDDKGVFWGEGGIFPEGLEGTCFEATPANMVNVDGVDVSSWLGGTHQFSYDAPTNRVTLTGEGAWIGIPKVATDGEVTTPQNSVSFKIVIEERDGYDHMNVQFIYEWGVWVFNYASYTNPALEPDIVMEQEPIEDLESLTPTAMFNTFASTDAEDVQVLVPTESTVVLTVGVDDPADATATKVGKYERVAEMFQELQFRTEYRIQFDNFTTVSLDVYIPSEGNDFDAGLTKNISIIIANAHDYTEWWNHHLQYDVDVEDVKLDEWQTFTFQLNAPTSGPGIDVGHPLEREDLNFFAISIGGGGHSVPGTFYIRDFKFE